MGMGPGMGMMRHGQMRGQAGLAPALTSTEAQHSTIDQIAPDFDVECFDLMRQVKIDMEVDFMSVSSYGGATQSSGVVRIIKDLNFNIHNRHVLLVEDIIDSGLTARYLLDNLRTRRPASVEICALLDGFREQYANLQQYFRRC